MKRPGSWPPHDIHTRQERDNIIPCLLQIDASELRPYVTWGTSPEMVVSVEDRVPDPDREKDAVKREGMERALRYMGLTPNTPMTAIKIDKVFIGSCTNSRIEDLRAAAAVVRGRRRADNVKLAMVVPGSGLVKAQAEAEGLDATGLVLPRRRPRHAGEYIANHRAPNTTIRNQGNRPITKRE